jgi:DNA-binding NtrC family response regulator
MSEQPRILVIDDETSILDTLRILLKGEGFHVVTAASGREGLEKVGEETVDLVLTDIRMPGVDGLQILEAARDRNPDLPVILMTAQANLRSAMDAVNKGAFYYIQKPFANEELVAICRRAVESGQLKRENTTLKTELKRRGGGDGADPVGGSRAFRKVLETARTVAPTESTVLISGESGTGKEVIARFIHDRSDRAGGTFVSINCGALPETLLESELFGHVKGSFTGAVRDKDGLLVAARGGTFFLDEVGEMTPSVQVKLLRALQEREVIPVGATVPVPVDVRIIAATNRDLEDDIRRGKFRSDLFYRLNVISLHMPPLRDRDDDINVLAEHFLRRFAERRGEPVPRLSEEAGEVMREYDWPGNVRELENAMERAVVFAGDGEIEASDLPEAVRNRTAKPLVGDELPPNPTLEIIERAYIRWVLHAEGGNKSRTAQVLGIDPSTLYRKLQRYDLEDE